MMTLYTSRLLARECASGAVIRVYPNYRFFSTKQPVTHPFLRWSKPPSPDLRTFLDLSKARLASLVLSTTLSGYLMAPAPLSLTTLAITSLGTFLCISSANTLNQWLEAPFDAQMSRTRNRVLVRHVVTPTNAFLLGIASGVSGVFILAQVNYLTAFLGGGNIVLYAGVYTLLKRLSIVNTWVGAVVGAIPPMIGWAAATGNLDLGAWILGSVVYAWQFPHFNALSWRLRDDYCRAGYEMMVLTSPTLNSAMALTHSVLLLPLCWSSTWVGLTSPLFLISSTALNLSLIIPSWRFYRNSSDKTARSLFRASLWHLPLVLCLFIIHKIEK